MILLVILYALNDGLRIALVNYYPILMISSVEVEFLDMITPQYLATLLVGERLLELLRNSKFIAVSVGTFFVLWAKNATNGSVKIALMR